ncbi:serine O-acetyltransferase [Flavobacterium cerinum]|uniref:Serine acetyltransferase n=1 Tax=Flavobacterium cerinum TaxID=2502784 RepID=A0ABY5IY32_9FLAO|nr:serine acetyltransferase [Flavobacterium cerinum]UUC47047.1 serine acetyltransferase [Flavobacterium cerinum]
MTLYQLIQSDYDKYKKYGGNLLGVIFLTQGFWAIFQYRIAHFFFTRVRIFGLRHFLLVFCLLWQKIIEIMTGISIPASVSIGGSFYIGHFSGIILNGKTVIGDNCNISQGVTIGFSGVGEYRGVPVIGNNVYIGANAVVAGKIVIEDNVLIGACSLVNKSVPANSIVVGVPAKVISSKGLKGSKGYI